MDSYLQSRFSSKQRTWLGGTATSWVQDSAVFNVWMVILGALSIKLKRSQEMKLCFKGHASQYGHQTTENINEKTNQDVKVKLEASV